MLGKLCHYSDRFLHRNISDVIPAVETLSIDTSPWQLILKYQTTPHGG